MKHYAASKSRRTYIHVFHSATERDAWVCAKAGREALSERQVELRRSRSEYGAYDSFYHIVH